MRWPPLAKTHTLVVLSACYGGAFLEPLPARPTALC